MGSVILLFLLCSLAPFLAAADVFCDNVKLLAATLPNNTSSSPVHFATATVGKAPDAVYALAYCPSDVVNSIDCSKCVARTFARVFNATPPPQQQCYKNVSVYGPDPCILLYSDEDILSTYNTSAAQNGKDMLFERWNVRNVTGDIFLISGLIRELMAATMKKAASMALRRFATGVMDSGTTFPLVYSMAQCKPDLSAGDCLACLRDLLGTVSSTMSLRIGGQVYVIRCNFRYEASQFYDGKPMLQLGPHSAPAPASTVTNKRRVSKLWAIPLALVPLAAAAFLCFRFYSRRLKGSRHVRHLERVEQLVWQWKNSEFSVFDFHQVQEATNNFSEEMKLGQGGFGAVYKGQFPEGLEIAVKRLASHSGQGFLEFKNEVQLIAKLQHTNLVRLLGCCSQQEEKILVYEYLPNKSLDFFIFDKNKRSLLDWSKLVAIIEGIARGLLYLHKHSRLRVIHRDLKPGNILLDNEMNPKISDFGLTKIFDSDNTEANSTRRVVGTYGYMAPEYASEGIFSIKSDVFSFGVVVLEILSGKRNSGVEQCGDLTNLLEYAWQLWEEERWIDLVDATLVPESHSVEMMRCINIALLCVQESAADRPTMSDIVAMLTSENIIMAQPKQPAYFRNEGEFTPPKLCSINEMTISILTPR